MGLREELQADLAEAFDADDELADAVNAFTGSHTISGQYDPVTEQGTSVEVSYSGRGVFASYSVNRVDGVNIKHGDLKLVALTNEVTGKPGLQHTITTRDLVTGEDQQYSVLDVGIDAAGAAYNIQLRRK